MFRFSISGVSSQSAGKACPKCDSSYLDRIPRRLIERVFCLFVSIRRYQCGSCGWKGNMRFDGE